MPDPKKQFEKINVVKEHVMPVLEEPKKFFNEPTEKFVNLKENRISARLHKQRAALPPKQKIKKL